MTIQIDPKLSPFEKLVTIIRCLRDPEKGCPWDIEQTHQSLKPYLIEEAYELLDAIDSSPEKMREELGDVILQVVLHSQIAAERKDFTIADVLEGISKKLVERHPHVFGEVKVKDSKEVTENWEALKKKERKSEKGMLSGLPKGLPALLRAELMGERVARVGFDWNSAAEVKSKVKEELAEFLAADEKTQAEEFGDLLFSLAQLARKLNLSAEGVLQQANHKFADRFQKLEERAGKSLKEFSAAELESLWQKVKAEEKT